MKHRDVKTILSSMSEGKKKYETKKSIKKGFKTLEDYILDKIVQEENRRNEVRNLVVFNKKKGKKFLFEPIKDKFPNEVVNNLFPEIVHKVRDKINLGNILHVPKRTRGITSSGRPNNCHENARMCAEMFGGRKVTGYGVHIHKMWTNDGCDITQFYHHSVWETPEGKLVDINQTNDHILNKYGEQTDTYFIPIFIDENEKVTNNLSKFIWFKGESFIVMNEEEDQILLTGQGKDNPTEVTGLIGINLKSLYNLYKQKGLYCGQIQSAPKLVKLNGTLRDGFFHKFAFKFWNGGYLSGRFNEPSLATGKTYNEILCERMC